MFWLRLGHLSSLFGSQVFNLVCFAKQEGILARRSVSQKTGKPVSQSAHGQKACLS